MRGVSHAFEAFDRVQLERPHHASLAASAARRRSHQSNADGGAMHRCLLLVFALLSAPLLAQDKAADQHPNQQLIREYTELGRNGQYERQMGFWAQDAVNNGRKVRPEMIRTTLEDIYRTFPDYRSEIEQSVAVGDLVVNLSRVSGTHKGVAQTSFNGGLLKGAKASGRRFEVLQTHWWRIRDGKIVWHQCVRDDLGMLRQLGLLPADPPQPPPTSKPSQ
jgi:predicted ester cyclase